jgi:vacuolar-type H+-ATPase subunit C/Vma6
LSPEDISELVVTTTPKITKEATQKMINAESVNEAISELANTVYKDIIPQSATDDIEAILQIEKGFEVISIKRVISSFRSVFSVGIMLSALKLMNIEVRNLAAIASGVEQNVPVEEIIARLIRPETET